MPEPKVQMLTIDDYWDLPDDGRRYEILEGWLEVTPSPTYEHQKTSGRLHNKLSRYLDQNPLGDVIAAPMDVILANDMVCQPDLLYVSKERIPAIVRDRVWGAPDLVVEILSPGTAKRDRIIKSQMYDRHGVKEYWILDPDAHLIFRFTREDSGFGSPERYGPGQSFEGPLFPGLRILVDEILPPV